MEDEVGGRSVVTQPVVGAVKLAITNPFLSFTLTTFNLCEFTREVGKL